jgi:hypothetical protein
LDPLAIGLWERTTIFIPDGVDDYVGDGVPGAIAVAGNKDAADHVLMVCRQHGEHLNVEALDHLEEAHLERL